jgi:chromosomal replication initiator protein
MNRDELELLNNAKELLKEEISNISFITWINPLEIKEMTDKKIVLLVTSTFQKDVIEKKYLDLISNTFKYLTNKDYEISTYCTEKGAENSSVVNTRTMNSSTGLNPNYTFDTYVVGNNNRFAQAAALAVAEAPGASYFPLFLYGGVGLGKTHLMHAIGNQILQTFSDKKVLYVTSEKFTNEFINSIKDNKNEEFRNKYRNMDVLLIDDIQFIAGKKQVQEEFFHTFNTLKENNCQIIMSSDKPPKDIDNLEDRLKSRFEWGLIADVSNADYETRLAILRKKVQLENIIIDDNVLSNIAIRVDSNIRELEGTLNKIVAKASLTHSPISMELAEQCINEVISRKEKVISADYIQEVVAKYFNIPQKDIKSSKRSNDIAYPRQIAMFLCRDLANMPFTKIGDEFGKRDHTTVMHACSKIDTEIRTNKNTKAIVDSVKKIIIEKE